MVDVSEPVEAQIDQDQSYIRTQFHEFSGKPDEYTPLDEYFRCSVSQLSQFGGEADPTDNKSAPWHPFDTYEEFTFFEWVTATRLTAKEIDNLLNLIHNVWSPNCTTLSFKSHRDLLKVFAREPPISVPVST
jgi:hypothetical protein